jgi:PII-like signaling protein
MIADALKLSVYFGESVATGRLMASEALMRRLERRGSATAAPLRGIEGFGINRRIRAHHAGRRRAVLPLRRRTRSR